MARELVSRNPGAPVDADLRRGVSTAYYALFHLLVHEATVHLVAIAALRPRMARSFDHRVMRVVCNEYAQLRPNPSSGVLQTAVGEVVPPQIGIIAAAFVLLQQVRQDADYNLAATITAAEADAHVKSAEDAFANWAAVQADPAAATFLAELLCRGIPKR